MRSSLLVDRARRIEGMEGEREGHVVDARHRRTAIGGRLTPVRNLINRLMSVMGQ